MNPLPPKAFWTVDREGGWQEKRSGNENGDLKRGGGLKGARKVQKKADIEGWR